MHQHRGKNVHSSKGGSIFNWRTLPKVGQNSIGVDNINERLKRAIERPFATAFKPVPAYASARAWDIARRAGDKQDEADTAEAVLTHIKSGSINRMPPDQLDSIAPILKEFLSQVAHHRQRLQRRAERSAPKALFLRL